MPARFARTRLRRPASGAIFAAAMSMTAAGSIPVFAATTTGQLPISLRADNTCNLSVGGPLDFGIVSQPGGTQQLTAATSLTVRCVLRGTAYTVELDKGLHGASTTSRRLSNGNGHTIAYALYSQNGGSSLCGANRGVQWGDTSGGCIVSATNQASDQTFQVNGTVTVSEPHHGEYGDTITVTLTY